MGAKKYSHPFLFWLVDECEYEPISIKKPKQILLIKYFLVQCNYLLINNYCIGKTFMTTLSKKQKKQSILPIVSNSLMMW